MVKFRVNPHNDKSDHSLEEVVVELPPLCRPSSSSSGAQGQMEQRQCQYNGPQFLMPMSSPQSVSSSLLTIPNYRFGPQFPAPHTLTESVDGLYLPSWPRNSPAGPLHQYPYGTGYHLSVYSFFGWPGQSEPPKSRQLPLHGTSLWNVNVQTESGKVNVTANNMIELQCKHNIGPTLVNGPVGSEEPVNMDQDPWLVELTKIEKMASVRQVADRSQNHPSWPIKLTKENLTASQRIMDKTKGRWSEEGEIDVERQIVQLEDKMTRVWEWLVASEIVNRKQ